LNKPYQISPHAALHSTVMIDECSLGGSKERGLNYFLLLKKGEL